MPLSNPILGSDGMLIRQHMRSEDYVQGVSGWIIESNGSVEFNDAVFRGDIVANSFVTGEDPDPRIEVNGPSVAAGPFTSGTIGFYPGAGTDGGFIVDTEISGYNRFRMEGPDIHPSINNPGYVSIETSASGAIDPTVYVGGEQIYLFPTADLTFDVGNDIIGDVDNDIALTAANEITIIATANDINMSTAATDIHLISARNLNLRSNGGSGPQFQMNNNGNFNMANVSRLFVNGIGTSASAFNDLRRNSADGEIIMQTSSAAFKTNIEPMAPGWSDQLLNVELVTFDAVETVDYPDELKGITWAIPGTIAEEVATTFPDAVIHDGQGHPVGVSSDVLIAALIQKVQELCQWRDDVNRRG